MYACLVNDNKARSSFYTTLEEAYEYMVYMLGVTGIENLDTRQLEYIRHPKTLEVERVTNEQ